MGFAIAFDLRDLNQRLTRGASASIVRRHRPAIGASQFKHQAVRDVAVMRDCERLTPGLFLIIIHIIPQHRRRCTGERGERQHLVRLLLPITKHDDAVEVIAAGH